MGKYSGLKGKVPFVPTVRDDAFRMGIEEESVLTLLELTKKYNAVALEGSELAKKTKANNLKKDVLEFLIRGRIDELGEDNVPSMNGYTWTPTSVPIAVVDDLPAVVKYLSEHEEMKDLLILKPSEISSRVSNFVKNEAVTDQLQIITKTDPETGEDVTEVRSTIPGVAVYLKPDLSRVVSKRSLKE